jgi:hypothetical protein
LVSHTGERTQAEGVREYDAEKGIWAQVGRGNKGMKKTNNRGVYDLYYSKILFLPVIK